jgi:serine/threonine protein phosphatase PrpC
VLLHNDIIACANVGDSRAGIVKVDAIDQPALLTMLSRDHTPVEQDEKERIVNAGGKVMPCMGTLCSPRPVRQLHRPSQDLGPDGRRTWPHDEQELWRPNRPPRRNDCYPGYSTFTPEVKIFRREPNVKALIVGSDGLWEKTSEAALVNFVRKNYREPNSAEKICKELVAASTNRWNKVDQHHSGMHFLP